MELGKKGLGLQNRSGDHGGKEKGIERQIVPLPGPKASGIGLLQKPELLECKEAQPQRGPAWGNPPPGEKPGVLENRQHANMPRRRQNQAAPPVNGGPGSHGMYRGNAGRQSGRENQESRPAAANDIENQTGKGQHFRRDMPVPAGGREAEGGSNG